MNVIDYLIDDENRIERRLQDLVDNYLNWTQDRSFEEIKKIINALGIHVRDKETLLTNNLKSTDGIEPVLEKCVAERKAIDDEIDNLTQLHVDEPGFKAGLDKLLHVVSEHNRFCESEFFPKLGERLSSNDLEHIQQQMDQIVMS
jgi:hypothetical protein